MEVWKDIPEYEDYQASDQGRVKSLKFGKECILKGGIGGGYRKVALCKNGKQKMFKVAVLVAMTFLGHIPNGYKIIVDHRDNNPLNDWLYNLQLITARDNTSKDRKGYSSKHVGVYWDKHANKWRARIRINGKKIYLGSFEFELEASKTYQKALKELK